jgi:hypothetical protein
LRTIYSNYYINEFSPHILNQCQDDYEKICNALPEPNADENVQYIYLILRPLKHEFTFKEFIEALLYVGIGMFTRVYDHIILSNLDTKFYSLVEDLNCKSEKHATICEIFDREQAPIVIRMRTKSRAASACLEYGTIKAIGKLLFNPILDPNGFKFNSLKT